MVIRRFDVWLVNLDPTVGSEIKKTRPALVVSPDEMNTHISTVIIAPMTTKGATTPPACLARSRASRARWCLISFARWIGCGW